MDFGSITITNPFAKSSSAPKTTPVTNFWALPALRTFHFGTGKTFNAYQPADKKFTDPDIVNHINPNEKIPTTFSQTVTENNDGECKLENAGIVVAETGEEKDEVLFDEPCILYVCGAEGYSNIGTGPFHLNKTGSFHRITMRRDPLMQIVLNTRCTPHNNPKISGKNKNFVRFLAPRVDVDPDVSQVLAAKFSSAEAAEKLIKLWTDVASRT